jgi:hypothetical protein
MVHRGDEIFLESPPDTPVLFPNRVVQTVMMGMTHVSTGRADLGAYRCNRQSILSARTTTLRVSEWNRSDCQGQATND